MNDDVCGVRKRIRRFRSWHDFILSFRHKQTSSASSSYSCSSTGYQCSHSYATSTSKVKKKYTDAVLNSSPTSLCFFFLLYLSLLHSLPPFTTFSINYFPFHIKALLRLVITNFEFLLNQTFVQLSSSGVCIMIRLWPTKSSTPHFYEQLQSTFMPKMKFLVLCEYMNRVPSCSATEVVLRLTSCCVGQQLFWSQSCLLRRFSAQIGGHIAHLTTSDARMGMDQMETETETEMGMEMEMEPMVQIMMLLLVA